MLKTMKIIIEREMTKAEYEAYKRFAAIQIDWLQLETRGSVKCTTQLPGGKVVGKPTLIKLIK
jgi:hypothetical protein